MTSVQRIKQFIGGVLMLLCSLLLAASPHEGFYVVALILCISSILGGLRALFYYFNMARHKVGGKGMLYLGIILLDFGVFTLTLADIPRLYLVLYLMVLYAFSGAVSILRAREAKLYGGSWRLNMTLGIGKIVIAVIAVIFGLIYGSAEILVDIYSFSLFYSAVAQIIGAFRKTAIVYIQ